MLPAVSMVGTHSSRCCDTGQAVIIDPHTGQAVCSCQYSAAVLACARAPASTAAGYPFNGLNVFPTSTDPSILYPSLVSSLAQDESSLYICHWDNCVLKETHTHVYGQTYMFLDKRLRFSKLHITCFTITRRFRITHWVFKYYALGVLKLHIGVLKLSFQTCVFLNKHMCFSIGYTSCTLGPIHYAFYIRHTRFKINKCVL